MAKNKPLTDEQIDEYIENASLLSDAIDLAISRSFMSQAHIKGKITAGKVNDKDQVSLSDDDVKEIRTGALSRVPQSIKVLSGRSEKPIDATEKAKEIFNNYGSKKQLKMLDDRLPEVLGKTCEFPELGQS